MVFARLRLAAQNLRSLRETSAIAAAICAAPATASLSRSAETSTVASWPNGGKPSARAVRELLRVERLVVVIAHRAAPRSDRARTSARSRGPARVSRPARPATCVSSWKVRSAARKSGRCRPTSAATTPTSGTPGKSWPLATICVPTSTSSSPSRSRRSTISVGRGALRCRGRAARSARAGTRAHLLLDALGAEAEQRSVGRAAARAALGRRAAVLAVVAAQRAVGRVVDEPDVAVGAALGVAALEAQDPRREAAPVQEQDRLRARAQRLGERARSGRDRIELAPARRRLALAREVDDLDRGQRLAADPVREHDAA